RATPDPAPVLRSGHDRRRQRLAPVPPHHVPLPDPDHLLQRPAHHGARVPVVHPRVHRQRRHRPARRLDAAVHALPLPARVRGLPDGLRLGDGVAAAGGAGRDHRSGLLQRPLLGALRGGLMSATVHTAPHPVSRYLFPRRPSRSRLIRGLSRHAVTISLLVIMLYPIIWMVAASLRPDAQVIGSLSPVPENPTLDNYRIGLTPSTFLNFPRYFLNSFLVAALAVAGNLFASTLTAY